MTPSFFRTEVLLIGSLAKLQASGIGSAINDVSTHELSCPKGQHQAVPGWWIAKHL